MNEFRRLDATVDLPPEWDDIAEDYFQQKSFLLHTEKYNHCQQRYYLCLNNGKLISAAIVYSLNLDILTFTKIKSPLKMNIVGIPCSVSSQGIFGNINAIEGLKNHIYKVEKGFVLTLNLKIEPKDPSRAHGKTLPSVIMPNCFTTEDEYFNSLRSAYRRRLKKINQPMAELKLEKIHCSGFSEEMYDQYLEVYKKSKGKLEKLSFDFFRNLPAEFILTVCFKNDNVIGWNIGLNHKGIYYFFLGGIDYNKNKTYNTYLRLLTVIIKDGIENKAKYIELGQTAEIPKMRIGGELSPRYMEAHHSNFIFNSLLRLSGNLLEYKRKLGNIRALKN